MNDNFKELEEFLSTNKVANVKIDYLDMSINTKVNSIDVVENKLNINNQVVVNGMDLTLASQRESVFLYVDHQAHGCYISFD